MLTAAARIQVALPAGWTVQAETTVSGLDGASTPPAAPTHGSLSCEKAQPWRRTMSRPNVPWLRTTYCPPSIDSSPCRASDSGPYTADVGRSLPQHPAAASAARTRHRLRRRNRKPVPDVGRAVGPTVRSRRERRSVAGSGRPTTTLKGLPAARLVRALADFVPPYSVADLADLAGASLGLAYRLSDYLVGEGLLTRSERGPITDVDWPELLRGGARTLDTSIPARRVASSNRAGLTASSRLRQAAAIAALRGQWLLGHSALCLIRRSGWDSSTRTTHCNSRRTLDCAPWMLAPT